MTFFGSGVTSTGVWPAGSQLSGTATVNASSFINGIPSTPFIGLTPFSIGPALSADYFATGLQPNPGNLVDPIATPYNDTGDKYHVVIDFSGTTGGSNPGVLPAGSIFALIDLDSTENYRQITATNAANAVITTPWINGPNGYFDMNNPMTPMAFMVPMPTLTGPVARRLPNVRPERQLRRRHVAVQDDAGREDDQLRHGTRDRRQPISGRRRRRLGFLHNRSRADDRRACFDRTCF